MNPFEVFVFDDIDHAKATVKQRLETIKMMNLFNEGAPDSRFFYWRPHTKPPIPADTTADLWEKGQPTNFYFRQKGGTAYEAITQLCDPATVTKGECWGGFVACIWWGASRAMGPLDFNNLYPGDKALDMDLSLIHI